jgi:WD40 repeat protein
MKPFHKFPTEHKAVIHDVSYDFYGKRLATCSSDQKVKVWDLDEESHWKKTAEWKAHKGSVWKVEWAHPEFGQVIASCSVDRSICIWEEGEEEVRGQGRTWIKRAEIVDSRDSVRDIKFAPHHMGLKLATCSADGFIRIYEAMDIMNLNHWSLTAEFESHKGGSNCISWNSSAFDKPSMAVGSAGDQEVKVWEYNEQQGRWKVAYALNGHAEEVHDVAWAPNLGRTYNLIATGSKDKTVRIWRLPTARSPTQFAPYEEAALKEHKDAVWRVQWNVTGTILASSGDDGNVCLWKANFKGQWQLLSMVGGDDDDAEPTFISAKQDD